MTPGDRSVLAASATPELTLTTCNPAFQRQQPTGRPGRSLLLVGDGGGECHDDHDDATEGAHGRDRRRRQPGRGSGELAPALRWGVGVLVAGAAVLLGGRRRRARGQRLLVYGAGTAGVLVVLFFFFGAVSPLLPASF